MTIKPQLTWNDEDDEVCLTWIGRNGRVDLLIDIRAGAVSWAACTRSHAADKWSGEDYCATLPRPFLDALKAVVE